MWSLGDPAFQEEEKTSTLLVSFRVSFEECLQGGGVLNLDSAKQKEYRQETLLWIVEVTGKDTQREINLVAICKRVAQRHYVYV